MHLCWVCIGPSRHSCKKNSASTLAEVRCDINNLLCTHTKEKGCAVFDLVGLWLNIDRAWDYGCWVIISCEPCLYPATVAIVYATFISLNLHLLWEISLLLCPYVDLFEHHFLSFSVCCYVAWLLKIIPFVLVEINQKLFYLYSFVVSYGYLMIWIITTCSNSYAGSPCIYEWFYLVIVNSIKMREGL
jgi:hypothetical protein